MYKESTINCSKENNKCRELNTLLIYRIRQKNKLNILDSIKHK